MSLGRIFVMGTNVFREVIRDRILYIIGFYALLMVVVMQLLPQIAASTEDKIFLDFGLAAMNVLGLIVAVFVGTGLVSKEIEKRTVLSLIAKPISRAEFIIAKHLGLSSVLALLVGVMTVIYLALLQFQGITYSLVSILLASVFLFLQLSLITAFALALGVFTSSVLATLLTFAVYLMGNFSQDLVNIGRISKNPGFERVTQTLYLILPDLSRLDLKNLAVYGTQLLPSPLTLLANAGYGVVYIVLVLAIAILVFARREF
ncbi:ABC transporter permease [Chlorogloea sp. CCALA 695]|uniref:ABC transporter permease n=2 Tax=Chlorogloea sp. CCALA 695 TaxID=2107693 RepID=UPI000D0713A8|nr:ABC transporter permease [Chlorogloea sp. CCALA 695]PSB29209.1 ABC transporter permease [Chlorogloea sp. CCALA 695]